MLPHLGYSPTIRASPPFPFCNETANAGCCSGALLKAKGIRCPGCYSGSRRLSRQQGDACTELLRHCKGNLGVEPRAIVRCYRTFPMIERALQAFGLVSPSGPRAHYNYRSSSAVPANNTAAPGVLLASGSRRMMPTHRSTDSPFAVSY